MADNAVTGLPYVSHPPNRTTPMNKNILYTLIEVSFFRADLHIDALALVPLPSVDAFAQAREHGAMPP